MALFFIERLLLTTSFTGNVVYWQRCLLATSFTGKILSDCGSYAKCLMPSDDTQKWVNLPYFGVVVHHRKQQ